MIGREMNSPLVSILIPVYNVEAYLPKCLDTVLGQSYTNLQVVLIDDGSRDGSWGVMQEYAAKDSRIEIYHQENQGVASTRNNLLEKVMGEYVLFVDSDDWIELDMVECLVTLARDNQSSFVMCDRVVNDTEPKREPQTIQILTQKQAIHDFLRHEYFIGSLCNKLLSSSLLHNKRFHCGISYGEDALFCWYVLQNTPNVVVTDRQLYHYRMNEGSISHETFGPKKFSGHMTWQTINEDVEANWPQYASIARGRWAIQDTLLIRDAALSNYKYDDNIKMLQEAVKQCHRFSRKSHISTRKMRLYAYSVARLYSLAKLV